MPLPYRLGDLPQRSRPVPERVDGEPYADDVARAAGTESSVDALK